MARSGRVVGWFEASHVMGTLWIDFAVRSSSVLTRVPPPVMTSETERPRVRTSSGVPVRAVPLKSQVMLGRGAPFARHVKRVEDAVSRTT